MDHVVAVVEIILVNLVRSGDNAVVIALATRKLPPQHRRRAVFWGGAVAIVSRIAFTLPMAYLETPDLGKTRNIGPFNRRLFCVEQPAEFT